jgi:4-amino-4-deoxy-L-arabinose transferase-like glycosyltransferase
VVQLFNVLLAVGIAFFVFLIARELFPASKISQTTALAFFALSPPVTRTAVMYHGQTLATLLSTAALYVVVRAIMRRELTAKAGALAGVLLGLGVVTRPFVVATVGAACLALAVHYAFTRRREVFGMGGVLILCVALLSTPWFISRQVTAGNPLPLSCSSLTTVGCPVGRKQPKPDRLEPSPTVFSMPYRPGLLNSAPQMVYADWWGDYFLYYEIPSGIREENAAGRLPDGRLPEPYHGARVRQSYVGLVPTLLMLAGLLGLIWEGARRRRAAVLVLPATVGFVAVAELAFYILYPSIDDDTLKALYVVTAIPPLAVAAGWALWRLRERSLPAFSVGVALLLAAATLNVQYLWLDNFIGRLPG